MNIKKIITISLAILAGLFLLIQAIPYGRDHSNPPVVKEPNWDSPQTRELAVRACFDCHSNETVWPWYSNIAPVSWLVQNHVEEGRHELNFSEYGMVASNGEEGEDEEGEMGEMGGREGADVDDMIEEIQEGGMPPANYLPMHPTAKLTNAEKDALIAGLKATFGGN